MQRNQLLQKIVDCNEYKAVESVANEMILNWNSQSSVKETEFLTTRATIEKEAKVTAIKTFLNELEKQAHG